MHCREPRDMFTKDGKVLAVPLYMEGYGFVVNRQMFEDAGVDFESMMTYEGMKAGFDTLKAKIDSGEMKEKYRTWRRLWSIRPRNSGSQAITM